MSKIHYPIVVAVIAALSVLRLNAQTAPASPTALTSNAQKLTSAITTAMPLFQAGDISDGETALFAANRDAAGTPEWNRDAGQALIGMACIFRQKGDGVTVRKLEKEALTQLNRALAGAGNNKRLAANVYMLMGFAQEHLGGTRAEAEASYQTAVQNETVKGRVAAILKRMKLEDAILATRGKPAAGTGNQ